MTRSRRLGPLVVAVVASAVVVAGPAYADDPPPAPNTVECTRLVDADESVTAAKAATPIDADKVEAAEKAATEKLCTGTAATGQQGGDQSSTDKKPGADDPASSGPAVGSPDASAQSKRTGAPAAGSRPGPAAVGPAPKRAGRPAGDRDCPDFATQAQAQQYFESIGGSATNNADRLDANHNGVACESYFDDGDNQDAAVSTTGDDGSEAKTSGDQVTDVPEGSAQTGGF